MRIAIIVSLGLLYFSIGPSSAGGLIGDLLNEVAPGLGTQLDDINKNLGNPIDHGVAPSPGLEQNITELCRENPRLEQCVEIYGPAIDARENGSPIRR